jgi:tetratricopeptide (TPR) repeat protein
VIARIPARGSGLSLLILALWTTAAAAQPPAFSRTRIYEFRIAPPGPRFGKAGVTPLPPAVQAEVERGRGLAEVGQLDGAREVLTKALEHAPHHPLVLIELTGVESARGAWKSVEQLARTERAAARDSLLLGQDLTQALQRLGKPRDAAQVVTEAWVASPGFTDWARMTLDTLVLADSKGVREIVRRAATAHPERVDLAKGAAALEWKLGDPATAMRLLAAADVGSKGALRWSFAEELLEHGVPRDSVAAVDVLLDLAGDHEGDAAFRVRAARRAWETGGTATPNARRVATALEDVPVERWDRDLAIGVIRSLRQGGATDESRRLLRSLGDRAQTIPEIAVERALTDLRDGPPERAIPALRDLAGSSDEAAFHYADALFFSGQPDSAVKWYEVASQNPSSPVTGSALERLYLIEDGEPKASLGAYGRLAYERWRNDTRKALALADSLYRSLPHASLWAQVAIDLAALREASGDGKAALEPLLALAEALPDSRLAPIARQRAGDIYRSWYHDEAKALEQYEECLARYPKAWNAPEVRRQMEALRREHRF